MRDLTAIRERYLRDKMPVRLGGLAANLARIKSFDGGNPCEGLAAAFRPKAFSPTESHPIARAIRNLRKVG